MPVHKEALFTCLDDFAKVYEEWERHHLIPSTKQRRRQGKLSLSKMLFIMVFFHVSGFRCFKLFYLYGLCQHYRALFNELPSYGRFVSLQPRLFMPLCMLLHHLSGEKTGIIHVLKAGCRWCDCPSDYGPSTTIYNRYNRWSSRLIWTRIMDALTKAAQANQSTSIDSTFIKAHRSAHVGKGGRMRRPLALRAAARQRKSIA